MVQSTTFLTVSQAVVAAAVLLTGALFLPSSNDPINPIKLSALLVCAVVALGLVGAHTIRHRVLRVPPLWTLAVSAALLVAFVVAALSAPLGGIAVLGTYGRNSGLLAYAAAIVLFAVTLLAANALTVRLIAIGFIAAGAFSGGYGLLQHFGVDAIKWANEFDPVIAALGNPNFAAAYLAICTPPALWGAIRSAWPLALRIACAGVALICLTANLLADAYQGPIAVAAGIYVVLLALALEQAPRFRRAATSALAAVGAAGVAVLVAGVAGLGPAGRIFSGGSFDARGWYYEAALGMFRDKPFTGVGLDMYGTFWRQYRPVEALYGLGGTAFSDAAHSVPLQMLAQGGLLLGLTYVAFVLLVAFRLMWGLLRLRGEQRLLLGALGGAWVAYQVQSLVSIDQVPLITAHFVLAASVLVASGIDVQERRLPGALAPAAATAGKGKRPRRPQQLQPRQLGTADVVLLTGLAVLMAVGSWVALRPVRADTAALDGNRELRLGNGNAALERYDKAIALAPSVDVYYRFKAALLDQVGQPDMAEQTRFAAIDAGAYDVGGLRQIAAIEESKGNIEQSRALFERVLELDPTTPETITTVATFELRHSGAERARAVLETAVRVLPNEAGLWATLGDARLVLDDAARAREAYQRALRLSPEQPTALEGLQKLAAAS